MPQGSMTLLDIAKKNGSDPLVGLIEEVVSVAPEIELGAARTIKGISYKTLVRTNLPRGGFRDANQGVAPVKSEYANKTFEAMIFNPKWKCDKAVAEADEDGKEAVIAREADGIMRGSLLHLGSQFYYGLANDAKGCPGLLSQYDAENMTVNATGSGQATTSVWAVKFGPQYVQWLWGNDGQLNLSDIVEQQMHDDDGNYYTALFHQNGGYANKVRGGGSTPVGGPDGRRCPKGCEDDTSHRLRCPAHPERPRWIASFSGACLAARVSRHCTEITCNTVISAHSRFVVSVASTASHSATSPREVVHFARACAV